MELNNIADKEGISQGNLWYWRRSQR